MTPIRSEFLLKAGVYNCPQCRKKFSLDQEAIGRLRSRIEAGTLGIRCPDCGREIRTTELLEHDLTSKLMERLEETYSQGKVAQPICEKPRNEYQEKLHRLGHRSMIIPWKFCGVQMHSDGVFCHKCGKAQR